jgi:hypothetical protein
MVFDALTGLVDALNQVVAPPDDVDSEGEHYRNFRSILPVGYHTLKAAKVEHDVLYRRIELILDFCEKVEHHLRARVDDPESRLQDDVVFLIVNRRYVEDIQCRLPDCPSIPIYRDYATTMDQVATAAMGLDTGLILRKAREDRSDVSAFEPSRPLCSIAFRSQDRTPRHP